ncbi:class I SAM-dependent methyltransferase [Merismopedia glauca]|uniref:SAM-dependent methyltransferase n=1 Tax=Merismopedia glauca CCAP 1448/3 TaxID=1296344 RepID=A0A2T1BYW1_9CYAN|nr:class I SAM-dependent methyltransferase [Merismopedia glauca]PSB01053.1 SAM-dependent methyltransferase [Merismopedia glauca CCAP 1448/3]
MNESEIQNLRDKVKELATESIDKSQPYSWFETLYQQAAKDPNKVPWAKLKPHPELSIWLGNQSVVQGEKSALVIGCGLGDDAEALQAFGYNVTAFDVSPTAIAWCLERFPNSQVNYQVADLFELPENWLSAFDLVYECRNIQALPIHVRNAEGIEVRSLAISVVTSLVKLGGKLLVITRTRPSDSLPEGPPWGLSSEELEEFVNLGLTKIGDRAFLDEREIPHTSRLFTRIPIL